MPQRTNSVLSDEDHRRIEASQLGAFLRIYRMKTGYIRFMNWAGWFALIICMVVVITMSIAFLIGRSQLILLSLLTGCSSLLVTLLCWKIGIPYAQSERIIVCENGMLHVSRQIKREHTKIIRWEDILAVRKVLFEYYIQSREGEGLTFFLYQDLHELIALIEQRSHVSLGNT